MAIDSFLDPDIRLRFDFTETLVTYDPGPLPPNVESLLSQWLRSAFMLNPTIYMINRLAASIIADTGSLADATNRQVGLFKNNVTPGLTTVLGDLTEADFTSYARKNGGTSEALQDPATTDKVLRIPDPAGGWRWSPTDGVNLPQTIYGFFLYAANSAQLLGAFKFASPITLNGAGDMVEIPEVAFRMALSALS